MKYYSEEEIKKLLTKTDLADFATCTPEEYLEDVPCIEIKEPHGRIIDVNDLSYGSITDYTYEAHLVVSWEEIHNAPTILEASK